MQKNKANMSSLTNCNSVNPTVSRTSVNISRTTETNAKQSSANRSEHSAKMKMTKIQGFQTASGKNMSITEGALLKAKAIFSDETFQSCDSESVLSGPLHKCKDSAELKMSKVQGFQMASGKNLNISEEALLKAKTLFSEDLENYDSDHLLTKSLQKHMDSDKFKIPKIQRVHTAGGKDAKVTEEILKAKAKFSDETLESCNNVPCSHLLIESFHKRKDSVQLKVPKVQGFQTASGKNMKITKEMLLKAKSLFSDETLEGYTNVPCSDLLTESLQRRKDSVQVKVPKVQGFQTASGKDMKIAEETLLKAKALFSDETLEPCDNVPCSSLLSESLHKRKDSVQFKVSKLQGFQTASGKDMKISDETLLKAKALFSDETLLSESLQKCKDSAKFKMPKVQEFQTAGNKDMNTTQEVLLEAEALFSEETMEKYDVPLLNTPQQKHKDSAEFEVPQTQGFRTASGKDMNITKEALLKAKALFSDETLESCDNESLLEHKDSTKSEIPKVQGFRTASGKDMNITEEALLKAKALFSDETLQSCDNESLLGQKDSSKLEMPKIQVFQTASGKNMHVTEEALLKAKAIFSEETVEICGNEPSMLGHKDSSKLEMPKMQGFQAVSGKVTNITEEALLKAKALSSEEPMEICESSPPLTKSLQKRKINDLDDVSVNRETMSNQFKKLRFSNEFQVQENVCNKQERGKRGKSGTQDILSDKTEDTNELMDIGKQDIDLDINSLISNEIVESAAALLADENSSKNFDQWISPASTIEDNDVTNVPLSPVIGGQFVPKKRKSSGARRKSSNAAKSKESEFASTDYYLKQLRDKCINLDVEKEKLLLVDNQGSMNNEKKCETAIVNDFGDTQLMLDFIDQTAGILEKRLDSALKQEELVKLKEKSKAKPIIGKLYSHREINRNNRISWREISKGGAPILCTYQELIQRKLPPEILDVTADNAVIYKFRCSDFYGQSIVQNNIEGIHLEEGACLILDENGYVGISEIKRSFLASPGVDPNLLPNGWLENHYRWIVWKLASIDRIKFASVVLPRALTPSRVMMELKYRYDREIDRSQRPALRKILEKDDVASKRMILCVSSITEYDNPVDSTVNSNDLKAPSKKLTLTDGWYSVQATVDHAMIENITRGKVKVGTKLITYGSELLHCGQGCSPLEVPENVCLKIHTNATKRARWDTKLGYARSSRPICTKLKSICPYGGLIGKIKVVVARVYPILYHEKTSSGESIFRNTRCEEKASTAYEKECRSLTEAFYENAEKYFSTERRKSNSTPDSIDLAAMEWTKDREKLSEEKSLSKQEQQQLINTCRIKEETIRQKLKSRLKESLPPQRRVTPVLKIRIVEEETSAILSIWTPNEEVTDILKEGNCIIVCNVTPSMKRGNDLQLTAGWNTLFSRINISDKLYPQRTCTPLCDINKPNYSPAYGELDTVGIVVYIGNEPYGMKNFQAAYIACPYTESQSFYLSILFWHGISAYGYAEILQIGSFIACSNLEWRRATLWSIPMTYCTDRSTFTQNPKHNHLQGPFDELKRLVTNTSSYVSKCAAEISEEAQKKPTRHSDQFTPDKDHLNKMLSNKNCNSSNQEISERSLLSNQSAKSVVIQKRLDRLQCYGEASNLSPIVLNSSKRVSLDFQSPVRASDVKQPKAQVSLNVKFSTNSR